MAKIFPSKLMSGICAMAAAAIGVFGFGGLAMAAGLQVEFETGASPLFSEANFIPGNSVSRWVKVTNNDTNSHQINMGFYNTHGEDLASQFQFEIKREDNTSAYNNTLADAFTKPWIKISDANLTSGAAETYQFIITFNNNAGNDYQGKELGFDLCVGFDGDFTCTGNGPKKGSATASSMTSTNTSSGYGTSGGSLIVISNYNININTFCDEKMSKVVAIISWDTNLDAVGRALYVAAPVGFADPFNRNALPNYGYNSTSWETAFSKKHSAVIRGLVPGQRYAYRLDVKSKANWLITERLEFLPGCVLGASDEKDIIKDVMGVSTGVLGEMTDEEIARFMADLRAKNENSNNDQTGNNIAVATFAPAALAASNAPAPASSQNSANNYGALILLALFIIVALVAGRFLAKRLTR